MTLLIKFVAVFAVLGLVVSTLFGVLGGNRMGPLVVTMLVCTLLSAAVGGGAYKILEQRVPEFLEIFQSAGSFAGETADGSEYGESEDGDSGDLAAGEGPAAMSSDSGGETQAFGDHLIVNKIKIKNEPKLLAEAIRTMMSRDDA